MINEFDHVRIKSSGITGIVVDISTVNGKTNYEVESDEKGTPGGYGSENSWKLYSCKENEIEVIKNAGL